MSKPNPIRELYQLADKHGIPHDEVKAWVERWTLSVCVMRILTKSDILEAIDPGRLLVTTLRQVEMQITQELLTKAVHSTIGPIEYDDGSGPSGTEEFTLRATVFRNTPQEAP